ncbi:Type 1 glutamine amidotransferase-like domain-containing protein [Dysgonomonas alginatilytica]|nr:peptidase E [Dysgonomonas alginatilytica]
MKKRTLSLNFQRCIPLFLVVFFTFVTINPVVGQDLRSKANPEQTIFVWGSDINKKFIQYVVDLTNKPDPRICFLPTASADSKESIEYWESICKNLSIDPYICKVWVSSKTDTIPFEDILLSMDAIVVGGGNTLNMMAIWKAQAIDKILQKALKKGIILAGGSAGSICWFENGVSDSRPVDISIVDGLGFLPYSNCPHYEEKERKELFHRKILNKEIKAGYACDDLSGLLFKNGKFVEAVSKNELNNSYYITSKRGKLEIEKLQSEFLVNKDALSKSDYEVIEINKGITECLSENQNDITKAFVSFIKRVTKEDKLNEVLNSTRIMDILVYDHSLAAVINKREYDFYCVSLFYKHDNVWHSAGEDIGDTPVEAEISFRERAKMHMTRLNEKYQ